MENGLEMAGSNEQKSKMKKEFAYHKPSEEGVTLMNYYRERFSNLLTDIQEQVTGSAELTLCVRSMEVANMWLNKAINLSDPDAVMLIPGAEEKEGCCKGVSSCPDAA